MVTTHIKIIQKNKFKNTYKKVDMIQIHRNQFLFNIDYTLPNFTI